MYGTNIHIYVKTLSPQNRVTPRVFGYANRRWLFNDVEITEVFRNMNSLPDSYVGNLARRIIKKFVIYTS